MGHLIRWHLWCDRHDKKAEKKQIHNNIRSLALASVAGYQSPGFNEIDTPRWLVIWGKAVGREEIEEILEEQGVSDNARYASVLKQI